METRERARKIHFTVLKASQLRTHQVRGKPPKCFYSLAAGDSRPAKESKRSESWNPTWDEGFEIDELAVVHLAIYQRSLLQPRILLGEIVLRLEDLAQEQNDSSETEYELTKRGSTKQGKYGKVTIRIQFLDPSIVTPTPSGGSTPPPGLPLETQVNSAAEDASLGVLNLSSAGASSSTQPSTMLTSSDNFTRVCGYVEKLVYVGDALTKVNPWANFAWSILSAIPKSLVAQLDRDQRMQQLWAAAADMLDFLKDSRVALDSIPTSIVEAMMKQIYDCALFVREYAGRGFLKRSLQESLSSSCDRIVSQYIDSLRVLKEQFMSRSSMATFNICRDIQLGVLRLHDVLEEMKEAERSKLLSSLPGTSVPGARCDESRVCLPGTRTSLLGDIAEWVNDPDGARVFWLCGVAGSGKSMIANTITAQFTQLGRMGASFRFNRAVDGRNSPALVIGNIAYQLAHYSPQYRTALLYAVEKHGAMNTCSGLTDQLRKYIVDPLSRLEYSGPIVIVLDALDESGTESIREELLEALAAGASAMPAYVRLLLVSRDEIDIRGYLAPGSHLQSMNDVPRTDEDILVYIADELLKVRRRHTHLTPEWPGETAMAELGRRADGLFIWVTVASDYIRRSLDPDVSLRHLLSVGNSYTYRPRAESKLDQLYLDLLRRAMADHSPSEATVIFQYVMGSVIAAKTPVARTTLDRLLGLNQEEPEILYGGGHAELTTSESILAALGSIIRKDNHLIRVLHTSITDFLTNDQRCTDQRFYIDLSKQNLLLASRCLRSMAELKRDICNIRDSTKLNMEVADLEQRLKSCLPEHVRYASQFWYRHLLDATSPDNALYEDIRYFFSTYLLNWMEVMSLLNNISTIVIALGSVKTWIHHHFPSKTDDTAQLIDEALRFIQLFHEPIKQSAAHIYISALPFTSHNTILFRTYAPRLDGIPKSLSNPGPSQYLMTLPHKSGNLIAPIKRGGSLFAYTDDGKTIQLWDVVTCLPIAQLIGHSTTVSKVAFSPDETLIASGDEQGVIILWDASTYTPIGAPLSRPDKLPIRVEKFSISGNKIVALYKADCVVWDIGNRTLINISAFDQLLPENDTPGTSHNLDILLNPGSTLLIHMSEVRGDWKVEAVIDSVTGENVVPRFLKGSKMLKYVLVSPDNQTVVTIDEKNAISMLHKSSGETFGSSILVSQSAEAREPRIRFSGQNGRRLIVLTLGSGCIYMYDCNGVLMARPIESGCSLTSTNPGSTHITAIALSFDETRLVASTTKKHSNIMIWDVASAQLVATLDYLRAPFPEGLSLSLDNSKVILSSVHGVVVWHIETNLENGAKAWDKLPQSSVTGVVIAPRGRGILVGQKDGLVILYHDWEDVTARSPLISGRFPACFSPDATTIVTTSSDYSILRWASNTSHLVGSPWRGHQGPVVSVVFSTDEQVLSLSKDQTIRTWDLGSGQQTRAPIRVSDSIQAITMSRDGSRIVAAHDRGIVQFLASNTGQPVSQRIGSWEYAEFSSDGREVLRSTGKGRTQRLDCETGELLADIFSSGGCYVYTRGTRAPARHSSEWAHYKTILPVDHLDSMVTSPDGKCIAYGGDDTNILHIARSSDGKPLCPPLHLPYGYLYLMVEGQLVFSPDSTRLAALISGDVQIWNIKAIPTREIIPAVHTYPAGRIRVVNQIEAYRSDGWLRGEAGMRLLWLPDNLRDVWVATPEQRGHRALVVGREEAVVIDMEDFLRTPDGSGGWRAGGVQYVVDESGTALLLDGNAAYMAGK